MTIIPIRKSIPHPRPDLDASLAPQTRVTRVLSAGPGTRAIVDPSALFAAVATLPEGDALELQFERMPKAWRFSVTLAGPGAAADLDARLEGLLIWIAEGAKFDTADAPLAPPPEALRTLNPSGRSINLPGRKSVSALPVNSAVTSFTKALAQASRAGVTMLRIRLMAYTLPQEAMDVVVLAPNALLLHASPSEIALLEFLSVWQRTRRGVLCAVDFAGLEPGHPSENLISLALFGAPLTHRPVEGLDMRFASPEGSFPSWFPAFSTDELRILPKDAARNTDPGVGALRLGSDLAGQAVMLSARDRMQHVFMLGGTGTGKTTHMENLIQQDIENGEGVLLIDPHGDLSDAVIRRVPQSRLADLVVIDPADPECLWRMDLFATPGIDPDAERNRVANQLIAFFRQMNMHVPESVGPAFEMYFRNAIFLLMLTPQPEDRNILNFERVFSDAKFRARLAASCPDPQVKEFWGDIIANTRGDHDLSNITPYIINKMGQITGSPLTRRFLSPERQTSDFRKFMDEGKIVIFKLSKGVLGEYDCRFLGALTLFTLAEAALGRARIPASERKPFRVYVDEFQNLSTESAASMLAECRKFGLSLVLANQSLSQLGRTEFSRGTGDAALANCGTLIGFRLGLPDALSLSAAMQCDTPKDFLRLGLGEFIVRRLDGGAPQPPQHLTAPEPLG